MVKSARVVRKTKIAGPYLLAEPLRPSRELRRADVDRAAVDGYARAVARQKERKQLPFSNHVLDDGSGAVIEDVGRVGERHPLEHRADTGT